MRERERGQRETSTDTLKDRGNRYHRGREVMPAKEARETEVERKKTGEKHQ